MTAHRRPWSFSLRTLFVLVMIAAIPLTWLGYSLNWIMKRHRFLSRLHGSAAPIQTKSPPPSLWLFGEQGISHIGTTYHYDFETAKKLFPEAKVEQYLATPNRALRVNPIVPPTAFDLKFAKVSIGQTRAEVLDLLGDPTTKGFGTTNNAGVFGPGAQFTGRPSFPYEQWVYRNNGSGPIDYSEVWFGSLSGEPKEKWIVILNYAHPVGVVF